MVAVHNGGINPAFVHMHFVMDFRTNQPKNRKDDILITLLNIGTVGVRNCRNILGTNAVCRFDVAVLNVVTIHPVNHLQLIKYQKKVG